MNRSMSMKKDYNHLCGLDFSDHPAGSSGGEGGGWGAAGGWGASLGAAGGATSSSSSEGLPPLAPPAASTAANRLLFGRVGVMNFTVAALYFCNQRPGIFVAPYLLLQEIPESQIGFVLFVSGVVALILQTPAGQLVDEVHNKNRILVAGYLATAFGCLLLSNVVDIAVITLAVTINVVSDVFVFPSLYATTLGLFGSDGIDQQAPLNETGTHSGNAVFATLAGAIVVLGVAGPSSIFYICVAMRGVGIAIILCFINYYDIDFKRSRGLVDVVTVETSDLEASSHSKSSLASITLLAPEEPLSYRALLTDFHVIVFLVSVMLFHFSNAAMLPLLSQHLFINNSDQGFAFAAAAIITAQVSMVASASMAGRLVPRIGTKPLFISALLAIPLRGVFIVLLLQSELAFKNSFLLATQILDGLAGGIFGVLLVLITENLSRGSGRFAMLLGLAKTAEGVGASFSNLVGEVMAEHWGYDSAFIFLGVASLLPVALYGIFMPAAVVSELHEEGQKGSVERVHDNLSVASRHGGSLRAGSTAGSDMDSSVELRLRRSFGTRVDSAE